MDVGTFFYGAGSMLAGYLIFLFTRRYLPSYAAENGKNLATNEDIKEITEKIEGVKAAFDVERQAREHQSRLFLQTQDFTHRMRLAALDRRLQAHQEAYTQLARLVPEEVVRGERMNESELMDQVKRCIWWWEENCLYLSESARMAFTRGYLAAAELPAITQAAQAERGKRLGATVNTIVECLRTISESVALPAVALDSLPHPGKPDIGQT
jgi:hypothetical protein